MKGRKLLASLLTAVALVALMAVPAMAAEEVQKAATVTVTEYISFTITDPAPAGLQFGEMAAGTDDEAEANTPALTLTVAAETNVDCNIQTKGEDFAITIAKGTATGGSGTTLEDTSATFTAAGVAVSDIVINETDGSTATVTEVTSDTTLTFSGSLSGGYDNTFTSGDAYSVKAATPAKTIPIDNAHWDTDADKTAYTAMTTVYNTITTSTAGIQTAQEVWHWLSIPGGQYPGDYTGIFYYQAVKV